MTKPLQQISVCRFCLQATTVFESGCLSNKGERGERSCASFSFHNTVCGLAHHNTIMKVNRKKTESRSDSKQLAVLKNWKRTTKENCSEKQIKPHICHLTHFSLLSCLDLKGDWSQGSDSWRKCCKERVFIYSELWCCLFRMRFHTGCSVPLPHFLIISVKKESSLIVWGHRLCLERCCVTCLYLASSVNVPL